jgi:hypothetical protein
MERALRLQATYPWKYPRAAGDEIRSTDCSDGGPRCRRFGPLDAHVMECICWHDDACS